MEIVAVAGAFDVEEVDGFAVAAAVGGDVVVVEGELAVGLPQNSVVVDVDFAGAVFAAVVVAVLPFACALPCEYQACPWEFLQDLRPAHLHFLLCYWDSLWFGKLVIALLRVRFPKIVHEHQQHESLGVMEAWSSDRDIHACKFLLYILNEH